MTELCLEKRCRLHVFENDADVKCPIVFFEEKGGGVKKFILDTFSEHSNLKFHFHMKVTFERVVSDNNMDKEIEVFFVSFLKHAISESQIEDQIKASFEEITSKFDSFTSYGSGWVVKQIHHIDIMVILIFNSPYGSGGSPILPAPFQGCRSILSVRRVKLGDCFVFSIAAALEKNTEVPPNYNKNNLFSKHVSHFDPKSYQTNMPTHLFSKFESLNNIALNVYTISIKNSQYIKMVYISTKITKNDRVCNILLYKKHYYCITNINAFLARSRNSTAKKNTYFSCNNCHNIHRIKSLHSLALHKKKCTSNTFAERLPPKAGSVVKFKDFGKIFKSDFIFYLDFESYMQSTNRPKGEKTVLLEEHIPVSCGILRVSSNPIYNSEVETIHGDNIVDQLWEFLGNEYKKIKKILVENYVPIIWDADSKNKFQKQTHCECCGEFFTDSLPKYADHSHLDGKYRYCLCNKCNLTYGSMKKLNLVCVFHNFTHYDSHFLIKSLANKKDLSKVNIVPKNSEQYLALTANNFTFIDSLNFLKGSLQSLVHSLKLDGLHNFHFTKKLCGQTVELEKMTGKIIYPYDYARCLKDYNITSLPPKAAFDNKLTGQHISDSEYDEAVKMFEVFNCKSFLDYHLLYLKLDVCLLADVFENYRRKVYDTSNLEAAKFITANQLGYSMFLKQSKAELDCLDNMEMIEFVEKSIRGGISFVNKRFAMANNPYLGPRYDPKKERSYISYLDCVNLYAFCLAMKLPASGFRFLEEVEIEGLDLYTIDTDGDIGYLVQVDLEYPKEIHSKTRDYPFAVEKRVVKDEELSPYCKRMKQKLNKSSLQTEKLIGSCYDKDDYVIHFKLLKYFLNSGMRIKKVKKVLKFEQRAFLKPYIDSNTKMRQQAKSDFDRTYWKTRNNALYGKLLETKKDRIDVKLVNTQEQFDRLVSRANFSGIKQLDKNFVAISMRKINVTMDACIAAGSAVLDLSKLVMYKFYDIFTHKLFAGRKVDLLLSDTDSFIFHVFTDDLYKDLLVLKNECLDTSNYEEDHFLFSEINRMVPGKFKDEVPLKCVNGKTRLIQAFVGLKSKMYNIVLNTGVEFKRAKGIKKMSLDKVSFDHFRDSIFQENVIALYMRNIHSYNHRIYTEITKKSAIDAYDDKRFILENGIESLPYGMNCPQTS